MNVKGNDFQRMCGDVEEKLKLSAQLTELESSSTEGYSIINGGKKASGCSNEVNWADFTTKALLHSFGFYCKL